MAQLEFGLIVVGDEILRRKRRDRHFEFFSRLLLDRGMQLGWFSILPDDPALLTEALRASMARSTPVFSCGGIGATPDDHTRQCAAAAAGVPVVEHPEAAAIIKDKYGDEAYPNRICMAHFPEGSAIIPNPVNRIAGFSIEQHYFVPGFPDMAQPMAEWVLDTYYANRGEAIRELGARVYDTPESELMPLMQQLVRDWPGLKLSSLPRRADCSFVDLSLRGSEHVDAAFQEMLQGLAGLGVRFEPYGAGSPT